MRRYEPGSRETEADRLNNLQSLHRKLQEKLILLVRRQKDVAAWEVPHAEVIDTRDTLQQVNVSFTLLKPSYFFKKLKKESTECQSTAQSHSFEWANTCV